MRIINLYLKNFRNYKELNLNLDYDIIFITGSNGAGKTSILEGISFLNQLKSFRKVPNREIIRWNEPFFQARVQYQSSDKEETLHVGYGKKENNSASSSAYERVLKINKKNVDKISEFIGRIQTVIFTPDDIKIVDSDPAARRKYMDMVMSVVNPGYLIDLQEYNKTLKMRSSLLKKGITDELYLQSIDKILSSKGHSIVKARKDFIADYAEKLNHFVSLISNSRDSWKMNYFPSLDAESIEDYYQSLVSFRNQDKKLRVTSRGIHRDRILFYPDNIPVKKDVKTIASQGQKRTLVLSLKMAQYRYIQNIIKDSPILLIDDVFNELDISRREKIVSFLEETAQAIITTTDITGLEDFLQRKGMASRICEYSIETKESLPVIAEKKK